MPAVAKVYPLGDGLAKFLGEFVEMSSDAYRASPEWAALRARAFERDGFRCVFCNATATTVHHRTYERYGHEELGDVTSTCYDCHSVLHEHRNLE